MTIVAKTVETKKKKNSKTSSKDPLRHQIQFKSKRRVRDYLMLVSKNRSNGRGSKDRSEPSHRFASNSIHTKSGADNLQGNGLERSLGASQVSIQRGSQNPILLRRVVLEEHSFYLS